MKAITEFNGPHKWLSNFEPVSVEYEGLTYPSVEHAYQAQKADPAVRGAFTMGTPSQAKYLGRRIKMRPDWDVAKLQIMEDLLRLKFAPGGPFAALLLATGTARLIEGNWWGDHYWGVCNGRGLNHLGNLLMKLRTELQNTQAK